MAWYDHNHIITEIGGHWYDVDGLVPIESGEQANYYLLDSYGPSHVRSLEAGQSSHFKDQLGIYFIAVPINRSDSTTKPYLP
jgi:hypothetical protein